MENGISKILARHDAIVADLETNVRDTKLKLKRERLRVLMEHEHIRQKHEEAWRQADKLLETDAAGSALLIHLRSLQDKINQNNKMVVVT